MARGRSITKAQEMQVIALYLRGISIKDILKETGINSEQTVYSVLDEHSVERRKIKGAGKILVTLEEDTNKIVSGKYNKSAFINESIKYYSQYEEKRKAMKDETVSKIKELAELVIDANNEHGIAKAIKMISKAKNEEALHDFFVSIFKKYHVESNEAALGKIKECEIFLFSSVFDWRENADVLVIGIIEKLHEKEMKVHV